jgi:enhancer of polycomb-like protein
MLWSVTLLQIGLILVSLLIYYCFPFLIQHEAQLVDDGTALSGFQQVSSRYGSSDDDYADSDDTTTEQPYYRPPVLHPRYSDNKLSVIPTLRIKRERELKRRPQNNGWAFKRVLYLPVTASFLLPAMRVEQKLVASSSLLLLTGTSKSNKIVFRRMI